MNSFYRKDIKSYFKLILKCPFIKKMTLFSRCHKMFWMWSNVEGMFRCH